MATIKEVLYQELEKYAGEGINGHAYLTTDSKEQVFVVTGTANFNDQLIVNTRLLVRLVSDLVIIEKDINSDPLYEALIQAGVPRSQIVLAYAGEVAEIEN